MPDFFARWPAQACAFFGVASPDTNLAEASLQSEHFHLISRLGTGTDHRDCGNVLPRQMFRGDRACGPGSEVGDKSIVEDERDWGAGMGVEHNNHAVVRRQTAL